MGGGLRGEPQVTVMARPYPLRGMLKEKPLEISLADIASWPEYAAVAKAFAFKDRSPDWERGRQWRNPGVTPEMEADLIMKYGDGDFFQLDLSWLPRTRDFQAAGHAYSQHCRLIGRQRSMCMYLNMVEWPDSLTRAVRDFDRAPPPPTTNGARPWRRCAPRRRVYPN
jgi:hypothetical protein